MPTITRKSKKPVAPANAPDLSGTIVIDVTLSNKTVARIEKYKADNGILKIQEVVRLATGVFLTKQGY
jgi:hypothetical protein